MRGSVILGALGEAFGWLTYHGLISSNLEGDFITRKGYEVLEADNGLELVLARLGSMSISTRGLPPGCGANSS